MALSAVLTQAKTGAKLSTKVVSAIVETIWRQQRILKVLLAPIAFDRCLSRFDGSCSGGLRPPNAAGAPPNPGAHRAPLQCSGVLLETRSLPTLAHCYPRSFTFYVPDPSAPLLSLEKRATVALMGHNKGRDNARRRAKRRKKTERLALAKANKKKTKK